MGKDHRTLYTFTKLSKNILKDIKTKESIQLKNIGK